MAFHPYPQLLQPLCNAGRFGPPRGCPPASPWPWVAHPVSGRPGATHLALLGLACAPAPGLQPLNLAAPGPLAGSFFNRHAVRGPSPPPTDRALPVSGSLSPPSPGSFSPFPHGTTPLSVAGGTRALEGGPPSFPPRFPCRVVLTKCATSDHEVSRTGLSPPSANLSRLFRYLASCRGVPHAPPRIGSTPSRLRTCARLVAKVWAAAGSARRYSRPRACFSLLGLLRCFSSPACLH